MKKLKYITYIIDQCDIICVRIRNTLRQWFPSEGNNLDTLRRGGGHSANKITNILYKLLNIYKTCRYSKIYY